MKRIIIVGAGAAGMLAAIHAKNKEYRKRNKSKAWPDQF